MNWTSKQEKLSPRSQYLLKFIGNASTLGGLSTVEKEVWNSGVEGIITALNVKKEKIALTVLSDVDNYSAKEIERAEAFFRPKEEEQLSLCLATT